MSDLFKQLQEAKAEQVQQLAHSTPLSPESKQPAPVQPQKVPSAVTQISKRLSKPLLKPLSKDLSNLPSTEAVENLVFQLRKVAKARVNSDIPEAWKKQLDDTAYALGVGKYDLLMYIIADFLGELDPIE